MQIFQRKFSDWSVHVAIAMLICFAGAIAVGAQGPRVDHRMKQFERLRARTHEASKAMDACTLEWIEKLQKSTDPLVALIDVVEKQCDGLIAGYAYDRHQEHAFTQKDGPWFSVEKSIAWAVESNRRLAVRELVKLRAGAAQKPMLSFNRYDSFPDQQVESDDQTDKNSASPREAFRFWRSEMHLCADAWIKMLARSRDPLELVAEAIAQQCDKLAEVARSALVQANPDEPVEAELQLKTLFQQAITRELTKARAGVSPAKLR